MMTDQEMQERNRQQDLLRAQQIEQMKQATCIYEWERIGFGIQKREPKARTFISIGITLFMSTFSLLAFISFGINLSNMIFLFPPFAIFYYTRFLLMADEHYCYRLTATGVYHSKIALLPDQAYTFFRGLGWVGITCSIIALFTLGPIAFAGAGAGALLAFKLLDFHPEIHEDIILLTNDSIIFDIKDEHYLKVDNTDPETYEKLSYAGYLSFSSELEKYQALEHLRLVFEDMQVVEVNKEDEQYTHPYREPRAQYYREKEAEAERLRNEKNE